MAKSKPSETKRDDVYYQAMLARDPRFDGKFFVGVKTTGIYCRPICPARPKRENVEFFANHVAAERAGYRPCLRCRPESAPRSPAWIGKSATVQRAVRSLQNLNDAKFNEDRFADGFGVTARHLRRLFVDEIGKTPKQLFFETRLNLARKMILETRLPISEIAFASGFRSIRRFNDAFKDRFKKSPVDLQPKGSAKAHRPREANGPSASLQLRLAYRPPLNFTSLLNVYRSHQVGQLEWFEGETMSRVIEHDGHVGIVTIADDPAHACLVLDIEVPDAGAIYSIVQKVRGLFDLDSDPIVVANAIETDPKLKSILKKHAGIRLASGWDPFEVAIGAILGQLVSVERGRALVGDLIELLGRDSGLRRDGVSIKLFPTPEEIAAADLTTLKTTGIRKQTLKNFSQALIDGEITLDSTQPVEEFVKKVLLIRGIGPWTAHYMALRCLRHTDAFPATDLVLARALELHSASEIERMAPWRGYVAALLWREYSGQLMKAKPIAKSKRGQK